jgi:hypothetical protein
MSDYQLTPEKIRQFIIDRLSNPDGMELFLRANNGMLASIFLPESNRIDEALDNFKEYVASEYLNEDLIWHLFTITGFYYTWPFNLIIIKKNNNKYSLLCPPGVDAESFYNLDSDAYASIIIKIDDNTYQPIVQITNKFIIDNNVLQTTKKQEFSTFLISAEKKITDLIYFAIKNCQSKPNIYEKNKASLQDTVIELYDMGLIKSTVLLNYNNYSQITHILFTDDDNSNDESEYIKLPVKATPINKTLENNIRIDTDPDLDIIGVHKIDHDYVDITKLFKIILDISKLPKSNISQSFIPFYYIKNNKDQLVAIKFQNLTYAPFKPISITSFNKLKSNTVFNNIPFIFEELPENVDNSIAYKTNEIDQRSIYVKKTRFQQEAYERLRFQLAYHISSNNDLKKEIINLTNPISITKSTKDITSIRKKLQNLVVDIIQDIATLYDPDLTKYITPQIRLTCDDNNITDPHCGFDKKSKSYKVILPTNLILPNQDTQINNFKRYAILISDELLRNHVKRSELLDNKVSFYVNPSDIYFDPSKEILISNKDQLSKLKELYQKETTYTDKLSQHYFKSPSEIFSRGIPQVLFLLNPSWYEKTDLNPDEWIYNRSNIYDILNEILHTDLTLDLWNFIENNNWQNFLNVLQQILPDEYQHIFSDSQFREHIRYSKGSLTAIHLALISHLYGIKLIILNEDAKHKFICLGTTQTTKKSYLLLYSLNNQYYLIAKTSNLDLLFDTSNLSYIHKEESIPKKFFDLWNNSCNDTDNKSTEDPFDFLLAQFPSLEDSKKFSSAADIKSEPITKIKLSKIKLTSNKPDNSDKSNKPKITIVKPKITITKPSLLTKPKITIVKPASKPTLLTKPKITIVKPSTKPKITIVKPKPKITIVKPKPKITIVKPTRGRSRSKSPPKKRSRSTSAKRTSRSKSPKRSRSR